MAETKYCKLCQKEPDLCNSHIIPEYVYKLMYDDKHRYHNLSTLNNRSGKFEQKGLREELLCQQCETKLSRYEGYARHAFEDKNLTVPIVNGMLRGVATVSDIDYQRFKLFQLSILWRAGVAEGMFFKDVRLGSDEEAIRKMLMRDDPGDPNDYGCLMAGIVYNGKLMTDFMTDPEKIHMGGHRCYRFVFGGFSWTFFSADKRIEACISSKFLTASGVLTINFDEAMSTRFLRDMAEDMKNTGRI